MATVENVPANLYEIAMTLFNRAGHAGTLEPIYCNHSPEQVIYFDNQVDAVLSRQQRATLNAAAYISYLFDVSESVFGIHSNNIGCFYSIELTTPHFSRSQAAYDIHRALLPFIHGAFSIVLFRHDGQLMLSMQGFGSDAVLSDWYDEVTEMDQLADRIDVGDNCLDSARDYIADFIYNCARWYYIYPVSGEQAAYDMLPLDCFSKDSSETPEYSKDELKKIVREALHIAEKEYDFDFVELGTNSIISNFDVSAELDLLSLEIDIDEELEESPFGDDSEFEDDYIEEYDEASNDSELEKDEYEFADCENEIFQDPLKMLKLLEKNEN